MTIAVSKEQVLAALSQVQEPELHQDLVTLNMIRDLEIQGGKVSFTVMLTTPACPLRGQIEKEARQAVVAVAGVESVAIKWDSDVPNDGRMRGLVNMPIRNAVAVGSGKGGVGKSTVAVNIAVALAQSGARVGLLDADIYGPNIPTMMGVDRLPPPNGKKLVPAQAYGVKMISMGLLVKPGQPLIWRGPMLNSAIRQFLGEVEWGELDYLIVDLPPGTGDAALSLAQALPAERRDHRDAAAAGFAGRRKPRPADVPHARSADPGRDREHVLPGPARWHPHGHLWIGRRGAAGRRRRRRHSWARSRSIPRCARAAIAGKPIVIAQPEFGGCASPAWHCREVWRPRSASRRWVARTSCRSTSSIEQARRAFGARLQHSFPLFSCRRSPFS